MREGDLNIGIIFLEILICLNIEQKHFPLPDASILDNILTDANTKNYWKCLFMCNINIFSKNNIVSLPSINMPKNNPKYICKYITILITFSSII